MARNTGELRVSVDVGCRGHSVAVGLSSGELLEEFEIEPPRVSRRLFGLSHAAIAA